jgi:hypothetical protein
MIEDSSTEQMATVILRAAHTATNARYLRQLPLFRAESTLPEPMRELLARLDDAERQGSGR